MRDFIVPKPLRRWTKNSNSRPSLANTITIPCPVPISALPSVGCHEKHVRKDSIALSLGLEGSWSSCFCSATARGPTRGCRKSLGTLGRIQVGHILCDMRPYLFIYPTIYPIVLTPLFYSIMAPPHTPRKQKTPKTARREADTVRKTQFFKAVDSRGLKPLKLVYQEENVSKSTADYWLAQRRQNPDVAYRRLGAFRTGRPFKIPDQKLDQVLDPKSETRNQCYETQIEAFQLGCSVRCLQNSLRKRRRNAKLYSKAKVKWVSPKNKEIRQDYGHDYGDEDVEHFWSFVGWTDEAHVDPTAMGAGHVLREEGTRYEPENVAEIPPLQGVILHMSAFVSYWHKGDLTFYNDPDDIPELDINVQINAPKKKRPPKQRKSETLEQFKQSNRYLEYAAAKPHDVDIQPKGNSIT